MTVVRAVDHIMVRVSEADPMMELFAGLLGLPVSWPVQRSEFATYGWVTLGNANLEFWAAANNGDLPAGATLPMFHGVALEPENLRDSVRLLGERGVACKAPRPYITRNAEGKEVTNFTNAVVLDVSGPSNCVFFCEWGVEGTIFPWQGRLSTRERKAREQEHLHASDGGKLGVTGLLEIRMSTPALEETTDKWLAMAGQDQPPVALGGGVRLSLQAGPENRIDSIVIGVTSLDKARSALKEMRLLDEIETGEELALSRMACRGLHFCFKEGRPA